MNSLFSPANSQKQHIFNDPIHGHYELSPLSIKIIDTPQFQRLRDISQLGPTYYVFPGASSKRFEHCLGVAHLSRVFIREIHGRQPELKITAADMLCVELAGLCHDLGHGPFSHLFDAKVLPRIVKDPSFHFEHEHASIGIFDLLIQENGLLSEFHKNGLNEDDIHFIKELILGDPDGMPHGMTWKGRGEKTFLYDIVANKRNGIDVDKFDYFSRDCHTLGLSKSFDCLRLMRFARVFKVSRKVANCMHIVHKTKDSSLNGSIDAEGDSDGVMIAKYEICFHIKEAWNLYELFHTRYTLHKRAYQHRVVGAVDQMVAEALVLADPYLTVPGLNNVPKKMSQCPFDYHAYWRLGEYVLKMIENSTDERLGPSQAILNRLRCRDIFPCVSEILLSALTARRHKLNNQSIKKEILDLLDDFTSNNNDKSPLKAIKGGMYTKIASEDVFVAMVFMGYGKGTQNPVSDLTTFYQPLKPHEPSTNSDSEVSRDIFASELDANRSEVSSIDGINYKYYSIGLVPTASVSLLAPIAFEESYVRIYCRYKQQAPILRIVFQKWCARIQEPFSSTTSLKRPRSSTFNIEDENSQF